MLLAARQYWAVDNPRAECSPLKSRRSAIGPNSAGRRKLPKGRFQMATETLILYGFGNRFPVGHEPPYPL